MPERPNLLVIVTDQQNASMLSCAGNPHVRTPSMDGLAANGVRFDRAYCTAPVCGPARFSLMTGLMPSTLGLLSNRAPHLKTVPDTIKQNALGCLLRQAGYETAYAGKVHAPGMTVEDLGFEHICEDERDGLATAGAAFLQQKRDRPFCLVASFANPHDICYMAIRDAASTEAEHAIIRTGALPCRELDAALARPEGVSDAEFFEHHCPPLPDNFEPQADEPEAIRILLEGRPFRLTARSRWTETRWREHRWAYARLTERVDAQIGQLLKALHDSGLDDNTVVLLTADHGDMDASHRMEHKSTLYEEACRIPLVLRAPGIDKPGRADHEHLVSSGLDLLPTLCDYAGVTPPPGRAGQSLRPIVEGNADTPWRRAVPVECVIGRAMITDRHKYAVYDVGDRAEQLLNLESRPLEMANVLDDPRHAAPLAELRCLYAETHGNQPRQEADVIAALPGA